MKKSLFVAILLVGFNRPDTSSQVIEKIRDTRPQILYIAIDRAKLMHL